MSHAFRDVNLLARPRCTMMESQIRTLFPSLSLFHLTNDDLFKHHPPRKSLQDRNHASDGGSGCRIRPRFTEARFDPRHHVALTY